MMSPELLRAYHATTYRFTHEGAEYSMRIGEPNPSVDALLETLGVLSWAFISAENPRSVRCSRDENMQRHARLSDRLRAASVFVCEGEGRGDTPGWEPERSYFVAGIDEREAAELGREFDQAAVVVGTRGAPAQLMFCFETSTQT